jgi:DNA polymerase III subunit gamma/tau
VWDTLHRPLTFADVLGQVGTVQVLKARLRNGTALDTNYIFSGGSGMGKTTIGRIFARALLCQDISKTDPEPCNKCDNCTSILNDTSTAFTELDAASQGNIDQVRRIVEDLPFAVFGAPKRVYLIDECHRISKDAQDVLLKPLEERKLLGMFCTTEPEKVRGAIRSRCEEYHIRKVTREDVLARMKRILVAEGVEYDEDAVLIVIDFCGGHVRDVVNRLEMISQMGAITIESVREYLNLSVVSTYYEILLRIPGDPKGALALVDKACERVTPEELASGLAESAMSSFRLANGMSADFTFADKALSQQVSQLYGAQLIQVAEHFLRSRYITQVGLICDIVSLSQQLGSGRVIVAPRVAPRASFQPLSVQAQVQLEPELEANCDPPAASSPVELDPQPLTTEEASIQLETPSSPVTPPLAAVVPPLGERTIYGSFPKGKMGGVLPSGTHDDSGIRADGVGNLGSTDRRAYTDLDVRAVPMGLPGSQKKRKLVDFNNRSRDGRDILTSSVWRREFQEFLERGLQCQLNGSY